MVAAAGASAWVLTQSDAAKWRERVGADLPATAVASSSGTRIAPVVLTAQQLDDRARALSGHVYWLGPMKGRRYELSRDDSANAFVRYLPIGSAAGESAEVLTVATHPFANAFATTQRLAKGAGVDSRALVDGGVAWSKAATPENAYVAFPGVDYVIQISDPSKRARELAFSGQIQRVG